MEHETLHPAARRVLARLAADWEAALPSLSPTDVSALELALSEAVVRRTSPPTLLRRYREGVFAQPAKVDALELRRMEADLLALAGEKGFEPVQLSPVSTLGACAAVATVHQNKVLSAVRGLEVMSDPTNALALLYGARVKTGEVAGKTPQHLCATHRVVRAQPFHAPDQVQHFTLFAAVTGGLDGGGYAFEKEALAAHAALYETIFLKRLHIQARVRLRKMPGYTDGEGLIARLSDHLGEAMPGLPVERHPEDGDGGYYQGMQFSVLIEGAGRTMAIGDGGLVDWPQKLLGNRKQRMLISAVGVDRMLSVG